MKYDLENNRNKFTKREIPEEIAWLEKQKAKERLDRMAPIYNDKELFESALEKAWKYYNESASRTVDSFEDDYIECVFSKGFREGFLYKEKQKEQKSADIDLDNASIEYVHNNFYPGAVFTQDYIQGVMEDAFVDGANWQKERKPAEWKQENNKELTDFENAMMHIGCSFFGKNAGLDPNDTIAIKEQANLLLTLIQTPVKWSEEDEGYMNAIITIINRETALYPKGGATEDLNNDLIAWLKSRCLQIQKETHKIS